MQSTEKSVSAAPSIQCVFEQRRQLLVGWIEFAHESPANQMNVALGNDFMNSFSGFAATFKAFLEPAGKEIAQHVGALEVAYRQDAA